VTSSTCTCPLPAYFPHLLPMLRDSGVFDVRAALLFVQLSFAELVGAFVSRLSQLIVATLRYTRSPPVADLFRLHCCRLLVGLTRDASVCQILGKLDVGQLLRDFLTTSPSHSETIVAHAHMKAFADVAAAAVESVTVQRASTVPSVTYDDRELLGVVARYLHAAGLSRCVDRMPFKLCIGVFIIWMVSRSASELVSEAQLPQSTLPAAQCSPVVLSTPVRSTVSKPKKLSVTLRKSTSVTASAATPVGTGNTCEECDVTATPCRFSAAGHEPKQREATGSNTYQKELDLLMKGVFSPPTAPEKTPRTAMKRREPPTSDSGSMPQSVEPGTGKKRRIVPKRAPQPATQSTTLHRIVTSYLQDQLAKCKYPCSTLPALPLEGPPPTHLCKPPQLPSVRSNVVTRILSSRLGTLAPRVVNRDNYRLAYGSLSSGKVIRCTLGENNVDTDPFSVCAFSALQASDSSPFGQQ
jgi:hypothetical protein